jgi:putative phosphotransacetylase
MDLNANTIEAIVKKVISEMDVPAQEADDLTIPVGISNRHIHLSREDLDTLFGAGYELTPIKDLSQPASLPARNS